MSDAAQTMIENLRATFAGTMLTDHADIEPYLIDWRKTWRGIAMAVVFPNSVDDVASVVKWCAANDVAIVPQGGNTGQSGGSVPRDHGRNIVLSLAKLNRVRALDIANGTITVDAGCILQRVQDAAEAADRLFPLSLGAEGSCTIGGNLATNAGGTAVLRYGNARDLCLGLEVVTASGEIWDGLKGLRKDNSGYDLRDLFIGSDGTLGVITGAVLRLFPKPKTRVTAWAGIDNPHDGLALFDTLRIEYDTALTAFELISDECLSLVLRHFGDCRSPLQRRTRWYVLIELSETSGGDLRGLVEETLFAASQAALASEVVIAESVGQSKAFWALRECISEAQGREGGAIKHDIAVPVSAVARFIDETLVAVAKVFPAFRPVVFGHLGDGNLHFNFSSAEGAGLDAFMEQQVALNRIVHDRVRAYGGSISAEHGLGVLRRDEADEHRSAVERRLMATIKNALDPQGIMNPGKVFPGPL